MEYSILGRRNPDCNRCPKASLDIHILAPGIVSALRDFKKPLKSLELEEVDGMRECGVAIENQSQSLEYLYMNFNPFGIWGQPGQINQMPDRPKLRSLKVASGGVTGYLSSFPGDSFIYYHSEDDGLQPREFAEDAETDPHNQILLAGTLKTRYPSLTTLHLLIQPFCWDSYILIMELDNHQHFE